MEDSAAVVVVDSAVVVAAVDLEVVVAEEVVEVSQIYSTQVIYFTFNVIIIFMSNCKYTKRCQIN